MIDAGYRDWAMIDVDNRFIRFRRSHDRVALL